MLFWNLDEEKLTKENELWNMKFLESVCEIYIKGKEHEGKVPGYYATLKKNK